MSDTELDPRDERNDMPPKPPMLIVSEYHVSRHFGGREEGGWWFDRHSFNRLFAVTTSTEDTIKLAQALNQQESRERKASRRPQGRFSVAGGDDIVYIPETVIRQNDDTDEPRPRYE